MRNLAGLLLVLLVALVLTNMSSFKGLSIIQLDRLNELSVGTDPGGALGINGLNDGPTGSIEIGSNQGDEDRYMGTITNNFDFDIEFTLSIEIRVTELDYGSGEIPEWQNINVLLEKNGELEDSINFGNIELINVDPPISVVDQAEIVLGSGDNLDILLDSQSFINNAQDLEDFQAEALFSIDGGSTGAENITFNLSPVDDLRRQYFSWADDYEDPEPMTGFLYPDEALLPGPPDNGYTDNLDGSIEFLQYNPDSEDARINWYTAVNSTTDTVLHVMLDTPPSARTLEGTQTLKVLVRRTTNQTGSGAQNPKLQVRLYQGDDNLNIPIVPLEVVVEDPDWEVFSYTFEAGDLIDGLSGTNLKVWLYGETRGREAYRTTVEFGAIEWEYRYIEN